MVDTHRTSRKVEEAIHPAKSPRTSALAANPPKNISELGRKLLAIRKEIEESGIPLLTEEEIAKERAEQRRERYFD